MRVRRSRPGRDPELTRRREEHASRRPSRHTCQVDGPPMRTTNKRWSSWRGPIPRRSPSSTGATCPVSMPSPIAAPGVVEAAEDVTSAAFERALRHLGAFRWRPGGFGPWLFRIAANELVDHYRRIGPRGLAPGPGRRVAGSTRRSQLIPPSSWHARDAVDGSAARHGPPEPPLPAGARPALPGGPDARRGRRGAGRVQGDDGGRRPPRNARAAQGARGGGRR